MRTNTTLHIITLTNRNNDYLKKLNTSLVQVVCRGVFHNFINNEIMKNITFQQIVF